MTTDYRATYIWDWNECVPPIVKHWAALKHSPKYLMFANSYFLKSLIMHLDELLNYSQEKLGSVTFSRYYSSFLKLLSFVTESKARSSWCDFVHPSS